MRCCDCSARLLTRARTWLEWTLNNVTFAILPRSGRLSQVEQILAAEDTLKTLVSRYDTFLIADTRCGSSLGTLTWWFTRRRFSLRHEVAARTGTKDLARTVRAVETGRRCRSDMANILNAIATCVAERRQILLVAHLSVVILPDTVGRVRRISSSQALAPIAGIVAALWSVFEGRI